jgi:hypothetical protein
LSHESLHLLRDVDVPSDRCDRAVGGFGQHVPIAI